MRAVITVVGKDTVGILAKVSSVCAENNVNIIEVSQSILKDMFCMIMLVETTALTDSFSSFADKLKLEGEKQRLVISAMHEDVFDSMHRI